MNCPGNELLTDIIKDIARNFALCERRRMHNAKFRAESSLCGTILLTIWTQRS